MNFQIYFRCFFYVSMCFGLKLDLELFCGIIPFCVSTCKIGNLYRFLDINFGFTVTQIRIETICLFCNPSYGYITPNTKGLAFSTITRSGLELAFQYYRLQVWKYE